MRGAGATRHPSWPALNSAIVTVSEVVCELLNVSVTVNSFRAEVVNGCLGAGSVEVTPSPKFQSRTELGCEAAADGCPSNPDRRSVSKLVVTETAVGGKNTPGLLVTTTFTDL
jgi:hypothetical protein